MDWYFFVPIFALAATIAALTVAFVRPPSGSVAALKRRLATLEADHETLAAKTERLKKRHYALEGHVYGSDDDDEPEVVAAGGLNPEQGGDQPSLALIPDGPFPEAEFQAALAARKRGGLSG